jgi:hypothetical protein
MNQVYNVLSTLYKVLFHLLHYRPQPSRRIGIFRILRGADEGAELFNDGAVFGQSVDLAQQRLN